MPTQPTARQLIAYGRLLRGLHTAHFSRRAADVLAFSDQFKSLKDLREQPWQDDGDRPGLRTRLAKVAGCGPAILAEVEAYRNTGDARKQGPHPVKVTVELDAQTAGALEAWVRTQPEPLSRAEAVRRILAEGLLMERRRAVQGEAPRQVRTL